MLTEWLQISSTENLIKPSVYQGQYNLLCRSDEGTLFPLLREHGIAYTAYSPLASGFLLGNFTADGLQGGSRFAVASPYSGWYDKPALHAAVEKFGVIAMESGCGRGELALRWVVFHSRLGEGDAVILGGSRFEQIEGNLAQIQKGPLEKGVIERLNALWEGYDGEGWLEYLLRNMP